MSLGWSLVPWSHRLIIHERTNNVFPACFLGFGENNRLESTFKSGKIVIYNGDVATITAIIIQAYKSRVPWPCAVLKSGSPGDKFVFPHMDDPSQCIERTVFPPLPCGSRVTKHMFPTCVSAGSGLFIWFHWSIWLCLCQYRIVSVTIAL